MRGGGGGVVSGLSMQDVGRKFLLILRKTCGLQCMSEKQLLSHVHLENISANN